MCWSASSIETSSCNSILFTPSAEEEAEEEEAEKEAIHYAIYYFTSLVAFKYVVLFQDML